MGRSRTSTDQWLIALLGILLLVVAMAGVAEAVRGTVAAVYYQKATYGIPRPSTETALDLCRRAYGWYRWNYYFSIEVAERAYYDAQAGGTNAPVLLERARWWCERGLAQNPCKSQLRRLQTRFLWNESPAQAIAYWSAFTDWNYWEPYNHAVLAQLYAAAANFAEADRELALIRAFPDYADAAKAVEHERQTWDAMLRGDVDHLGE